MPNDPKVSVVAPEAPGVTMMVPNPRVGVRIPMTSELPVVKPLYSKMPPALPSPVSASPAKTRLELLLTTSADALVGFSTTLPSVIVSAPAKLGLTPGVTTCPLAMEPTVREDPVVFAKVTAVAEMALMYQPWLAGSEACVTVWPTTRFAVGRVKVGADVVPALTAVKVRLAVAPVTVPMVRLAAAAFAARFCEIWNCELLRICVMTDPSVMPVPEIG